MITVYDLETFRNFFSAVFLDIDTEELYRFVVHQSRNDFDDFIEFIRYNRGQIGFNNLAFDYPILHWIIQNRRNLSVTDPDKAARLIYKQAQQVIDDQFPQIAPWNEKINQLDLYKIWHFDNKAKITSLKDIAIALNWHRIQDLPYNHNHTVKDNEVETILDYNDNDVLITYEFYKESRDKIDVNLGLEKEYGINCLNFNDPKIGETIFLKFISDKKGVPMKELKQMKTYRDGVDLNDVILDYVEFQSDEFNQLLNKMKS